MGTTDYVIEASGLSKSYGDVKALHDLHLRIPKHSIFGFLGPNGAGKTTAIKLLLGLARPTSGSAKVFGHDIVQESIAVRKRVGYLAQDPRYYDRMTAREILRYTTQFFYSGSRRGIDDRVAETLSLVGLEDKADRPIKGFSGGERQRLGIAQAQVNHPDLLILDEPAANLDPAGRRDVLAVMERLRKYATVFYSTHILDDVQRVGDAVAILDHGQMVAQASIDDLLNGNEGTVFELTIKGNIEHAYSQVIGQPWVAGIDTSRSGEDGQWLVRVVDDERAERELLPLIICDGQCTVTSFGRKLFDLEEVFLATVEGGFDDSR
jgi:ABC-2 type transport system ATP-binding protein